MYISIVAEMKCIADFEKYARKKIAPDDWGYYAAGAGEGLTLKDNCEAFKRWRFRPRVLRKVANVEHPTTVLGTEIPFPICISPTAYHGLAHPEGEVATAKAAASMGIGMTLSLWSNITMEEIFAKVPNCIRWCHIQVANNRALTEHYVRRAERNGFTGFIATIDETVLIERNPRYQDGSVISFDTDAKNQSHTNIGESIKLFYNSKRSVSDIVYDNLGGMSEWESIDWLKNITKLPVVVKGILTAEMALEAIDHQVDGILISNHGARLYDGAFATIDVLPEIVKAVNGRCDVYLDGGIRKGTDIVKAIALGAKAVFIGRPILWGLACGGEDGVKDVLQILRDEFINTMQAIGVKSIKELQTIPDLVVHETKHFAKL